MVASGLGLSIQVEAIRFSSDNGCISKGNKNRFLKTYLHSHAYSPFTMAKLWKQPKYPLMEEKIKNELDGKLKLIRTLTTLGGIALALIIL